MLSKCCLLPVPPPRVLPLRGSFFKLPLIIFFLCPSSYPYPRPPSNSSSSHSTSNFSKKMSLSPTPISPTHSLGPKVSPATGAFSLTEAKPGSHLLCMYLGPQFCSCMQPGWLLSVWESSGVQVSWDGWSSHGAALLSFFQLSPNSASGVPASIHWLGASSILKKLCVSVNLSVCIFRD